VAISFNHSTNEPLNTSLLCIQMVYPDHAIVCFEKQQCFLKKEQFIEGYAIEINNTFYTQHEGYFKILCISQHRIISIFPTQ
jgi:hypothetical protein